MPGKYYIGPPTKETTYRPTDPDLAKKRDLHEMIRRIDEEGRGGAIVSFAREARRRLHVQKRRSQGRKPKSLFRK